MEDAYKVRGKIVVVGVNNEFRFWYLTVFEGCIWVFANFLRGNAVLGNPPCPPPVGSRLVSKKFRKDQYGPSKKFSQIY